METIFDESVFFNDEESTSPSPKFMGCLNPFLKFIKNYGEGFLLDSMDIFEVWLFNTFLSFSKLCIALVSFENSLVLFFLYTLQSACILLPYILERSCPFIFIGRIIYLLSGKDGSQYGSERAKSDEYSYHSNDLYSNSNSTNRGGANNNGPSGNISSISNGSGSGGGKDFNLDKVLPVVECLNKKIQESILFILNNVSLMNIDEKAEELKQYLTPEYYDYYSNHLIVHRISNNPNLHRTYLKLTDKQNSPDLDRKVLEWTYHAIRAILMSSKLVSVTERNLLKCLGLWLGMITLARDKPILHIDLPLKKLLLRSYEAGHLVSVLPFVSKVLVQTKYSQKVFKLPNPWLMSILRVYKKFSVMQSIPSTIKIDIDILFKELDISLNDIEPSDLVCDYGQQSANDGSNLFFDYRPKWMHSFASNSRLSAFFERNPLVRQFMATRLDHGIDQFITSNVDKLLNLASVTTRKLVLKDFAIESDMKKVYYSSQVMFMSLARKFIYVQSRICLGNVLESIWNVFSLNENDKPMVQEAIDLNLEMACKIIQDFVVKKGQVAFEKVLGRSLNEEFSFLKVDGNDIRTNASFLPMALRPSTSTDPTQMAVYENFLKLHSAARNNEEFAGDLGKLAMESSVNKSLQEIKAYFASLTHGVLRFELTSQVVSESLRKLLFFISCCKERDWMIQEVVVWVFGQLSMLQSGDQKDMGLVMNWHLQFLNGLSRISPAVFEYFVEHHVGLLRKRADFHFNAELACGLLQWKLIGPAHFDDWLSSQIRDNMPFAIGVSIRFLSKFVINPSRRLVAGRDLPKVLHELDSACAGDERVMDLVRMAREGVSSHGNIQRRQVMVEKILNYYQRLLISRIPNKLLSCFSDWIGMWQMSASPPTVAQGQHFVSQLQSYNFLNLKNSEWEAQIYNAILDMSVLSYLLMSLTQSTVQNQLISSLELPTSEQVKVLGLRTYSALESCVGLVTILDRIHEDKNFLSTIFSQASKVIHANYNAYISFLDQCPYYFFVSSLLTFLKEPCETERRWFILRCFVKFLHDTAPKILPGFVFAWLELLFDRSVVTHLLERKYEGWNSFQHLLVLYLEFLYPYLCRDLVNNWPIYVLYEGTTRVFLLLFHDYPEFLSYYSQVFCYKLPYACVQLRNIILSACPRNVRLYDPRDIDIEAMLKDSQMSAMPEFEMDHVLKPILEADLKGMLDEFIRNSDVKILDGLTAYLKIDYCKEANLHSITTDYNIVLLGSLILYLGDSKISHECRKTFVFHLCDQLDDEGCFYFFNEICNQLKYPNYHTRVYSDILLSFWEGARPGAPLTRHQRIIARIIVERLNVEWPKPWGLIFTSSQLKNNPKYCFGNVMEEALMIDPDLHMLIENII